MKKLPVSGANTFTSSIVAWCNKWETIPGAFWLEHSRGAKTSLCVPFEHRNAVSETREVKRAYLVIEKKETFIDIENGLRYMPSLSIDNFKLMSERSALLNSKYKAVYFTPVEVVNVEKDLSDTINILSEVSKSEKRIKAIQKRIDTTKQRLGRLTN